MKSNTLGIIISLLAAAFSLYRCIYYASLTNIEASFGFGVAAFWASTNALSLIDNQKLSNKNDNSAI